MAWLYLPSLWSDEDVVTLSEGPQVLSPMCCTSRYPEFKSLLPS